MKRTVQTAQGVFFGIKSGVPASIEDQANHFDALMTELREYWVTDFDYGSPCW